MTESCLALGVSQYFNTPATSKSNYIAEIDKEKCVACGQCTDHCANNAIQMGQKLCSKTPIEHLPMELPDDIEWTPEHWNPEHRTNREYIAGRHRSLQDRMPRSHCRSGLSETCCPGTAISTHWS